MSELLENVIKLGQVDMEPRAAQLQAVSNTVEFRVGNDAKAINFQDSRTFDQNPFVDEIKESSRMDDVIKEGKRLLNVIYSYRSCSKAIPMATAAADDTEKKAAYELLFKTLSPEIEKMKDLYEFQKKAISVFIANLNKLVKPALRKEVVSEAIMIRALNILDILILLDGLKDIKSCLQNDFSRYKRAFGYIRSGLPDAENINTLNNELQMFLGNPVHPYDLIMYTLKSEVHKVSGFEEALTELIEFASESILQQKNYLLPDEKFMFYRTAITLVFLFDGEDARDNSAFRSKKIKFEKLYEIYKYHPVLPLYMDMQTRVSLILERCVNYDKEKMEKNFMRLDAKQTKHNYDLPMYRHEIRTQHNEYISKFAFMINDVKARRSGIDDSKISQQNLNLVFHTVLEGLELMGKWKTLIVDHSSWRRAFPCPTEEYLKRGGSNQPGSEYEKVTSYGYSDEELYTLCDVIGMLKALGDLISNAEYLVAPLIRRYMYNEIQQFTQTFLARPMRKAFKKTRVTLEFMEHMRECASDWGDKKADDKDYRQKKKELEVKERDFLKRSVGPTTTQINLLRRCAFGVFSERAPGMSKGMFSEKDLKKEWEDEFRRFYNETFNYDYMLNLTENIRNLTDMSFLWFREFYLEITKCIQFPISMSLPWIMAEFLVRTPSIAENIFYPLDIYNDCADYALKHLKQQYLFDEIEAEVNLAFDQLMYVLSNLIFTYFKELASSIMLDKSYKTSMEALRNVSLDAIPAKYASIISQRDVRLLGRSIDIQTLLSEHLNNYFSSNIQYAISRFESTDLCHSLELVSMLEHIKLTHSLISQLISIDSYDIVFAKINEDGNFGSFRGRIVVHVYSEFVSDIIPNFVYNTVTERFVRGSEVFVEPPVRANPPKGVPSYFWYTHRYNKYFDATHRLCKGFFGKAHLLALLSIIDPLDTVILFDEICNALEYKVNYILSAYSTALLDGFDPMKLPSAKFGVIGGYGYFDLKLKPIAGYAQLRSKVFQCLREVGNSLAILHMWDKVANRKEFFQFQTQAYFEGVTPVEVLDPEFGSEFFQRSQGEKPYVSILKSTLPFFDDQSFSHNMTKMFEQLSKFSAETGRTASLFTAALSRLSQSLDESKVREEWKPRPPSGTILDVETPKDFCRLWSALQFLFCQMSAEELNGDFECDLSVFGDGFLWAGCSLLYLTGHRDKFEYLDFVYFILKMQTSVPESFEVDPKLKRKGKLTAEQALYPYVQSLLGIGKMVQNTNNYVFSLLESHLPAQKKLLFKFHPVQASVEVDAVLGNSDTQRPKFNSSVGPPSVPRNSKPQPGPPPHPSSSTGPAPPSRTLAPSATPIRRPPPPPTAARTQPPPSSSTPPFRPPPPSTIVSPLSSEQPSFTPPRAVTPPPRPVTPPTPPSQGQLLDSSDDDSSAEEDQPPVPSRAPPSRPPPPSSGARPFRPPPPPPASSLPPPPPPAQ